jgi:CheY-like chemotaxis protein
MLEVLKEKKIFIIEDDVANMAVFAVSLKKSGAIITREYYSQGIMAHLTESLPIDLILLDLMLSRGVSGYDVYDEIRANPQLKDIPVVIVTSMDPETEIPKAKAKGLNGFIGKPIISYKLAEDLAKVLNGEKIWLVSR